jgi:hypothetical protein
MSSAAENRRADKGDFFYLLGLSDHPQGEEPRSVTVWPLTPGPAPTAAAATYAPFKFCSGTRRSPATGPTRDARTKPGRAAGAFRQPSARPDAVPPVPATLVAGTLRADTFDNRRQVAGVIWS